VPTASGKGTAALEGEIACNSGGQADDKLWSALERVVLQCHAHSIGIARLIEQLK
jgi:hypothetical protein